MATHSQRSLSAQDRDSMYRLRYDTFHKRLGWQVHTEDGREFDEFDRFDNTHYIIGKAQDGTVDAHWRLLPTLGPYMLKDVFPELLDGHPAPQTGEVWELSRFALATDRLATGEHGGNTQIGFGRLSMALLREAGNFAFANGIKRYVTVTTAAIERMLNQTGLHVTRLGHPRKIGEVRTVSCFIEIDEKSVLAVERAEARFARQMTG